MAGRHSFLSEKTQKDFRFTVDIDEQNTLKDRTSANKLYLSVASNWSYSKVIPVLEWFASCQIITKNSVADAYGLEAEQLKDDDYRHVIASMLRVADFGIQSLQMRDAEPLLLSVMISLPILRPFTRYRIQREILLPTR